MDIITRARELWDTSQKPDKTLHMKLKENPFVHLALLTQLSSVPTSW